ncbi:cupin domain-containing protein [Robbsia sp. Bb-Pol-6]|uniref:Cupin domain-containing protein n=1 Tax=Robbsia betulipollinis TaxID=2981849 RepID=A0ABT3ZJ10_9BURK|nr:cupin domain-containing protein [Robbsia betulipollinis]MCY0385955.1 cupin domain-containing protein [Robbsia betulipollinis]
MDPVARAVAGSAARAGPRPARPDGLAAMIVHHPQDDTLLRFCTGDLPPGPALVVASHVSQCPACRHTLRLLENVGGALLADAEPVACGVDRTSAVAALLADPESAARRMEARAASGAGNRLPSAWEPMAGVTTGALPPLPAGMAVPAPLAAFPVTAWRPVSPGIRWARISFPGDPDSKVLLLRAQPGAALPLHTHTGPEYTYVLHGSLSGEGAVLHPGDLVESEPSLRHQPEVVSNGECICMLAVEGRLVMSTLLARIAQRIIGL